MADATLNDVIARLRSDNERQLREQGDTTKAVENLSGTLRGFLEYLELQALRQKEADSEKERRKSASIARSEERDLGFGSGMFGDAISYVIRFVGGVASFATGLVLATEGLGPSLANFRFFVRSIANTFFMPLRILASNLNKEFRIGRGIGNIGTYLSNQIKAIDNFFARRYSFNAAAGQFQRLARFGNTRFVSARDVSFYQKTLISLNNLFGRIGNFFKALRVPPAILNTFTGVTKTISNALGGGARGAVSGFANSRLVRGIFRFLQPIAFIFSLFDGVENAAAEMEDREGTFDRLIGGGIGGFVSGTLGSFFGEFANLIKDMPLWLIKQIVPADWLNEDGTFKRGEEGGNWFTSLLATVEDVDFARMIRELIQAPFDAVGRAIDHVRNLTGAKDTTEEGQAKAREAWNTWWGNWTSVRGIASNVGGIFRVLANIVFHPINAILSEIERAFTGDENIVPEGETFTQKITRYVTQLGEFLIGLIPSMDEIKASIARALGPGRIVDFLGLSGYLPFSSTEEAENILSTQFETMQALADRITSINENIAATGDTGGFYAEQLEAAERDLRLVRSETEAVLARAANTQGVNQTVVNNFAQQYETFQFPSNGAVDGNDLIVRRGGGGGAGNAR